MCKGTRTRAHTWEHSRTHTAAHAHTDPSTHSRVKGHGHSSCTGTHMHTHRCTRAHRCEHRQSCKGTRAQCTHTHTLTHTHSCTRAQTQEWVAPRPRLRAHLPAPLNAPATVQPSDCVRETKLPSTARQVLGWVAGLGGVCFPRRVSPALVPVSCSSHPPLSSFSGTLAAESGVIETSVPSAGCLPRPLHLGGFFWGSGHGSPGCCRLCSLAPPCPGLPQWAGSQEDGSPPLQPPLGWQVVGEAVWVV